MKAPDIAMLILYAFGMTAGQLMFKAASTTSGNNTGNNFIWSLMTNLWFLAAAALYAALTILWVWILTIVPLSRAYPFVVLSFVLTPLGAALFFGESLTANYAIGMVLIVAGLAFLVFKGA